MDIEERIKMAFDDLDYFGDVIFMETASKDECIYNSKKINEIKDLIKELNMKRGKLWIMNKVLLRI